MTEHYEHTDEEFSQILWERRQFSDNDWYWAIVAENEECAAGRCGGHSPSDEVL